MGIRGLFSMIEKETVFDMVDLVEEAKKNGNIEILVDFHAIVRFVTQTFTLKLGKDYDNEFLYFPIGVYDMFSDAFIDLHNGFKEAGIILVWVVDGPKGIDALASEQKEETWVSRDREDVKMMDGVLNACRRKFPLHDLNNLGPILHFETALAALKKAGAEVIYVLQGESDDFIAYEFHRRKSFAIWTNDTDFVIFRGCVLIFERLMNHNYGKDDLQLPFLDYDNPGKIFKKPNTLKVPMVNQGHILRLFQFTSHTEIIALSILKGNDNTSSFAAELQYHLGITKDPNKNPHVTHVAQFIRRNKITSENMGQLPAMKKFMANHPQLKESIQFCKDLYSLKRIEAKMKESIVIYDPTTNDDSLTSFLAKKLSRGEMAGKAYAIHFGVIHDSLCPEAPSNDCPAILSLLFEIRKQIYPYLLDDKLNEVVEWRSRTAGRSVFQCPVEHASFKTNMIKGKPDDDDIYALEKYGIDIFEEVICHQEKEGPRNYVKKYGIEKAFVCYLLRYMFLLTNEKNLTLSEMEFRALFVTAFYQFSVFKDVTFATILNQDVFLGMKICPSERCMMTASWFMNIYYTAKYLCGAAFNLTAEFPAPRCLMSGAVFYAFYENVMVDDNKRTMHLEDTLIDSVGVLEHDIMAMYEDEYKLITE